MSKLALRNVEHTAVHGRTYRFNTTTSTTSTTSTLPFSLIPSVQADSQPVTTPEQLPSQNLSSEHLSKEIYVPSSAHRFIIGRGGATIRQLKADTGAGITVPKFGHNIVINGTLQQVEDATALIDQIVLSSSVNSTPTHFISLPITDSNLHRKVEGFLSEVQKSNDDIHSSVCVAMPRLHITVGMLFLHTQRLVDEAVRLLSACELDIKKLLGNENIKVDFKGVKIMDTDAAKARVMYINPIEADGSGRLMRLCEFLIEKFSSAGLLKDEQRALKLHATIINTKHAPYRKSERTKTFSATSILDNHRDTVFGTCRLGMVQIARRGEFDASGCYKSEGAVLLE